MCRNNNTKVSYAYESAARLNLEFTSSQSEKEIKGLREEFNWKMKQVQALKRKEGEEKSLLSIVSGNIEELKKLRMEKDEQLVIMKEELKGLEEELKRKEATANVQLKEMEKLKAKIAEGDEALKKTRYSS